MRGAIIAALLIITALVLIPVFTAGLLDAFYGWFYDWLKNQKPDWWPEDWWFTEVLPSSLNITQNIWTTLYSIMLQLIAEFSEICDEVGRAFSDALAVVNITVPEEHVRTLGAVVLLTCLAGIAYIIYRAVRG